MEFADSTEPPAAVRHAPPWPLDPKMDGLLLDFDGTISEIAPAPSSAFLTEPMRSALQATFDRLGGRVAIVSGRTVEVLEQHIPFDGIMLVGVHGLEVRLRDGTLSRPEPAPGLAAARMRLSELVAREPGLLLEDKGLSVAVHYRSTPGLAPIVHAKARGLATMFGLHIQTGKMVVELRTPGADKGSAVARVMEDPAFQTFRPIFVGDDDTDEAAFNVATDLGGFGIRVGPVAAGSSAQFRLPDVDAVLAWLETVQ